MPSVYSHGLGFHAVDGEPGPVPILPDITGPFEAEVTFIFRDALNMTDLSFQRLFDICVDGGDYVVAIGQLASSKQLMLEVTTESGSYYAITAGDYELPVETPTTVRAGVEPSGQLWLEIDGEARVMGDVMDDVNELNQPRDTKLIGKSCIAGDDDLYGGVLGLRITPYGEPSIGTEQGRFQNYPAQIWEPFTVSFWARIDNLSAEGNQVLFDFSNGIDTNNVFMGNFGTTSEMQFCVYMEGSWYCVFWAGAIVEGEVAFWHAGIESDGTMWVSKNGDQTGYSYKEEPAVHPVTWKKEIRTKMLFGHGEYPADNSLSGFILGLQIDGVSLS